MAVASKRQAPLKVDPATDQLISHAAHFLGISKKDFVAEAAQAYLELRREEIRRGMVESMKLVDGSLTSAVSMLTGLSPERIEELGGGQVHAGLGEDGTGVSRVRLNALDLPAAEEEPGGSGVREPAEVIPRWLRFTHRLPPGWLGR